MTKNCKKASQNKPLKVLSYEFHPYIDDYFNKILKKEKPACKELIAELKRIKKILKGKNVIIKTDKIDRAAELIEKYFDIELFDWELFVIGLIHCYEDVEGYEAVLFDEFFIMMGRGNGKNGFISALSWYFTTEDHGVIGYNVDIIANSEQQATTSFEDIYNMLGNKWVKLKKFYHKTKTKIISKKTNSYIRFNTSRAESKDGTRTSCAIFDEVHIYQNYDLIEVFTQAFGKRKHSRVFYITTQGYVRGGVIDQEVETSKLVTSGEIKNSRRVSLIYKLDNKNEVDDKSMWEKPCPSISYLPVLKHQMEKEYAEMEYKPHIKKGFFTKRMNIITSSTNHQEVAPWNKVLKTNRPIPYEKLKGAMCLPTLDYATVNDFASCGLLFKIKNEIAFIEHTFVCHKALEVTSRKIKFPIDEAVKKGLITIVYGDSITPDIIANWFLEQRKTYNLLGVCTDEYRASLVRETFNKYGMPMNIVRSGPRTHSKIVPLIDNLFLEERLILGDNMTMRWYINNTYKEIDAKGNYTYKKVEPRLKKTDGFFGFVHGMSMIDELPEYDPDYVPKSFGVISY